MGDEAPPLKRARYVRIVRTNDDGNEAESTSGNEDNRKRKIAKKIPTSSQAPSTKLNQLNDYCIWEILKRLSVLELCQLAEVNHRFHKLARQYFWSKYKKFSLMMLSQNEADLVNLTLTHQCFQMFGDLMISVHIPMFILDFDVTLPNMFCLIGKHCGRKICEVKIDRVVNV